MANSDDFDYTTQEDETTGEIFQHVNWDRSSFTARFNEELLASATKGPRMTRDNGGNLPAGLTKITNTTGRAERVYTREEIQQTWDNLKMAMVPVMKDLVKVWDELRHNRPLMNALGIYRLPGDKPLIHNGKAPR